MRGPRSRHALGTTRERVAERGPVDGFDVVGAETGRAGRAQPLGHRREEARLCLRVGAGERRDHEGPQPGPGPHQALAFEVAVRLEHGVGVDRQLRDDLLRRRQLVTGLEQSELQRLVDLLDELEVGGDARARVEVELDHIAPFH